MAVSLVTSISTPTTSIQRSKNPPRAPSQAARKAIVYSKAEGRQSRALFPVFRSQCREECEQEQESPFTPCVNLRAAPGYVGSKACLLKALRTRASSERTGVRSCPRRRFFHSVCNTRTLTLDQF